MKLGIMYKMMCQSGHNFAFAMPAELLNTASFLSSWRSSYLIILWFWGNLEPIELLTFHGEHYSLVKVSSK